MSHHGPNPMNESLGATEKFPKGKLNKDDEGEIRFAIVADTKNKKVILNFDTPVAWLGFDPDQAKEVGQMLIDKANSIA